MSFMRALLLTLFISGSLFITGCSGSKALPRRPEKDLSGQFETSSVFSKIFTGFMLADPESGAILFEEQADKYYTPASNTKLWTYFLAQRILGDSMPALRMLERGDTLIIQGAGNPMLLHPDFEQLPFRNIMEDLKDRSSVLFFSDSNFRDERFGPGWSWADYGYYYQVEKSPLPLYGNVVRFTGDSTRSDTFYLQPEVFWPLTRYDARLDSLGPYPFRKEYSNQFSWNADCLDTVYFEREIPFRTHTAFVAKLLEDTLKRAVGLYEERLPDTLFETIYVPMPDTLLRRFLQQSDNFIAEQLVLMCSNELLGYLDANETLKLARDSLVNFSWDPPQWRDGSGLSRYNLFSPRSMISLLSQLYQDPGPEVLLPLLPAGGERGTIRNWYGATDGPYVFAKTGTLSNKHCLSGFIRTRSGRLLCFSFMHNNYIGSSTPVKEEMQKRLEWIRDNL